MLKGYCIQLSLLTTRVNMGNCIKEPSAESFLATPDTPVENKIRAQEQHINLRTSLDL